MNSGKSLTFYSLFDEINFIEIPILQRDYAQGRSEEGEVRTLFLRSLSNALTLEDTPSRQSLDLDFVYGNYEGDENEVFSVLDGQQRLTTLFLLHWYLAVENDRLSDFRGKFVTSEGQSRFTYKTRPSTTEFFNALMAKDFVIGEAKLSEQVRDCQWFYLSWQQDPTVQACLCMLDAIQEMFTGKADGLFEKLLDTAKPYITFQFLNLHSFGLSDELYIKMNARGKPLTVFENFKAKLEQFIQSYDQPWPDYRLSFKNGSVGGFEYFIHKIDSDWADLFWPYRNTHSKDNTFDDELMSFFRLIISYQYLLDNQNSQVQLAKAKSDIFGASGRLKAPTFSKYRELDCFNQGLIVRLIEVLDLIYSVGLSDNKITPYLEDSYYYSEEKTFERIVSNYASYDDKLRFFAFYTYLAKNDDLSELKDWMRVIYNLVENTIINTSDEFYRALFSINSLSQIDGPILEVLKGGCELSGFTGSQILEEKIKAHLLLKSNRWREVIIDAEKHPFFDGQIGFILNFSGILEFYRGQENCDWNEELDKQYFNYFEYYSKSAGNVFRVIRNSSGDIDYLWERAVLSEGVYFTEKNGDRYNMLSSRDTRNNIPRDHSWRRLMRIGSRDIEKKQQYVKAVIDNPLFDAEDIGHSLQVICAVALENPEISGWRRALIKHKELMKCCNQGFIEHNSQETILLSESQRNHYHHELYTKVLELELKQRKGLLAPFTTVGYNKVKSRDETACAKIKGWRFDGNNCHIEVRNSLIGINIKFIGKGASDYSGELLSVLDKQGFNQLNTETIISKIHNYYCKSGLNEAQEIISKIVSFCSVLKELEERVM